MATQLEQVVRTLNSRDIEQLTRYAESLARDSARLEALDGQPPQLKWIGCLKNGPYRSRLEAQEAAKHYRLFLLERGTPR